jgi:hypothetical protein
MECTKLPSRSVEALLITVKCVISDGKSNYNKYTVIHKVIVVIVCLLIINKAMDYTKLLVQQYMASPSGNICSIEILQLVLSAR